MSPSLRPSPAVRPRHAGRAALVAIFLATPALRASAFQDPQPQADDGPKPVRELQLDALPTSPLPRDATGANVQFIDTALQPRDKFPRLDYEDQAANFQLNQPITGDQSRATAVIASDTDNGATGTLTLSQIRGRFRDGETISDVKGGTAKVVGDLKPGIWVLDFAFKPVRTRTVEIPGKGRRQIYYLYYRVTNHGEKARPFVPQFTMVIPQSGRSYQDAVLPNAIDVLKLIETREDPSVKLLGAVDAIGMVPPSTKEGVDDAVYGVAIWEANDEILKADRFDIYVRGLSDGYKRVPNPDGQSSKVVYKTLKLQFDRPGDEKQPSSREIRVLDKAYEWTYW